METLKNTQITDFFFENSHSAKKLKMGPLGLKNAFLEIETRKKTKELSDEMKKP